MKMNFQPSSANANNLRLQHPHFGLLSASAAVRFGEGKGLGAREVCKNFSFFSYPRAESFSLSRLGRLVCVRLLSACANPCLCQMIVYENEFSAIICQRQQSPIATSALRSPLGFCRRSIWRRVRGWVREKFARTSLFFVPLEQNRSACCASGDLSAYGCCLLAQILVFVR